VSADDILPPDTVPSFSPRIEMGNIHENTVVHDSDEDADSEQDEGDMSITGDFGPGIVSRRRTMSLAGRDRRRSRMRSSITIPPSETGMEAKEFTVSVDRPHPPETDAFKALKAIANGSRQENDDGVASEDGEVDMDVSTAVTRLLAVRNSTGGQPPVHDRVEDSFSSIEDNFDDVDTGDCTVNVTNLMGSFREPEYDTDDVGDVTMSATSVIGAPISMSPASVSLTPSTAAPVTTKPAPFVPSSSASMLPVLTFNGSSVPSTPGSSNAGRGRTPSPVKPVFSRPASPVKQPIKQFTAAFAPPHQPLKRPLAASVQDGPNPTVTSPNKRRAVTVNESSTRKISVPVVPPTPKAIASQPSPSKGLPTKARRPSGYYRKSLAGPNTHAEAQAVQPSTSTSGPHSRQSGARLAPPKWESNVSATDPTPKVPLSNAQNGEVSCAHEISRQSVAISSPTLGCPIPASLATKHRPRADPQVSDPISAVYAIDDGAIESVEDNPENTPSLCATQVQQNVNAGQWASNVHGEDVPQEDALVSYHISQIMQSTSLTMLLFPVGPHLCRSVFHHDGDPLYGRYDVPASFHRTSFAAPAARVQ
jgi:hypothetical protein